MLMFSWNDPQATGMDIRKGTALFELSFLRLDTDQEAEI
jgi:hypothetical protein